MKNFQGNKTLKVVFGIVPTSGFGVKGYGHTERRRDVGTVSVGRREAIGP